MKFWLQTVLTKPYINEVTLTGQNPPLKCWWPFDLLLQLKRNLDFSILKILGLYINGLKVTGHQTLRFDPKQTQIRTERTCTLFVCKEQSGRLFLATFNFES